MRRRQKDEKPEKEVNPAVNEEEEITEDTAAPEPETEELPDIEPEEAAEPSPEAQELEALKEEMAKQKELYLRLAAEYDNFRKRTAREKLALSDDIKADCITSLLPVMDNLERALGASGAGEETMRKGVEMVVSQTSAIFEKLGVTSFGEPGDSFDPNFHHCVSTAASEEYQSGQITLVMQKGYMLGEKVIRPAMVQTAE